MNNTWTRLIYKIQLIVLIVLSGTQTLSALTINTAMGAVDITPSKTPKVVTLEHRYTEMVLSLGVTPIGVADIKSYQTFDGIDGIKLSHTLDVGRRAAPSIEAIARLKPNLIIGAKLRNANTYPLLSRIAPTLLFSYIEPALINPQEQEKHRKQTDKGKQTSLTQMFTEFNQVAKALNKTKEAQQIIQQYEQVMAKAKAKISQLKADGKLKNDSIAIAQFLPGSPKIRLFTVDSVAMEALRQIGLKPVWQEKSGRMGMGYLTVSTDVLAKLGNFHFFYFNERSDDSQLKATTNSPIWQSFVFVKKGNTHELAVKSWPWGGPLTLMQFVEQIVTALESSHD